MKFETKVVEVNGKFRGIVTRLGEQLSWTEEKGTHDEAFDAAEQWLHWYVNVPTGRVESIYYILEVPETWNGPHPKAHLYSGLRAKIGRAKNVMTRFGNLRTGSSSKLIIHALEPGGQELETERHDQFASDRRQGEWFAVSPALAKHMVQIWYRNRALPPEHQREVLDLMERTHILRMLREAMGKPFDMINPSINEEWRGSVFLDLRYAMPMDDGLNE